VPRFVPFRREKEFSATHAQVYWKFLIHAATRYRHTFGTAVTLAIMGYHFYAVTEESVPD